MSIGNDGRLVLKCRSTMSSASEACLFRVPEWFIVEVAEHFAKFLHHSPYFRFPYMHYVALYWRVSAQAVRAVTRQ